MNVYEFLTFNRTLLVYMALIIHNYMPKSCILLVHEKLQIYKTPTKYYLIHFIAQLLLKVFK